MNVRYLVAAIACFVAAKLCVEFSRYGSYVDEQGFLHEQFALVPIGWLFLFSGALLFVLSWVRRKQ